VRINFRLHFAVLAIGVAVRPRLSLSKAAFARSRQGNRSAYGRRQSADQALIGAPFTFGISSQGRRRMEALINMRADQIIKTLPGLRQNSA